MKKALICIALLSGGIAFVQFSTPLYASETAASSQGSTIRVVGIKVLSGGATVKNSKTAIIEDTPDGLKAYLNGDGPYTVRSSDRSGYDYMFRVGEWSYYFNM